MRVGEVVSWKVGEEVSWKVGEAQKMANNSFFLHIDCIQIKKSAIPMQGVNRKFVDNHLINITGNPIATVLFHK